MLRAGATALDDTEPLQILLKQPPSALDRLLCAGIGALVFLGLDGLTGLGSDPVLERHRRDDLQDPVRVQPRREIVRHDTRAPRQILETARRQPGVP